MIRVTVNLDTKTVKALEGMAERLAALTPAQQVAFKRAFAAKMNEQRHDAKSARWLEEAIADYERKTGHTL